MKSASALEDMGRSTFLSWRDIAEQFSIVHKINKFREDFAYLYGKYMQNGTPYCESGFVDEVSYSSKRPEPIFKNEGDIVLKKIIGIIIFLALAISCYFIQRNFNVSEQNKLSTTIMPNTSETIEPADTFVEKRSSLTYNNQEIQYLLIFPAKYTQTTNQWPMILFLHGGSGRGKNLDLVKSYGPPLIAEEQTDFPFVVLAPQCPEEEYWTTKADILAALLDDIIKRYKIDMDRVYLTGTSMGGNGTWNMASQHPEYFAAIAPMAAKPDIPNVWNKLFISMHNC